MGCKSSAIPEVALRAAGPEWALFINHTGACMALFILVSTVMFIFLASIWRQEGWLNVFLRFAFTGLAVWGIVLMVLWRGAA